MTFTFCSTPQLFWALAFLLFLTACGRKPVPQQDAGKSELMKLLIDGTNAYEQGMVKEAQAQFEKAVALRPTQFEAQLNLANALLRADQPEPAIASAQAALHLNKDSAAAYYVIGCSQLHLGQAAEAAFQRRAIWPFLD